MKHVSIWLPCSTTLQALWNENFKTLYSKWFSWKRGFKHNFETVSSPSPRLQSRRILLRSWSSMPRASLSAAGCWGRFLVLMPLYLLSGAAGSLIPQQIGCQEKRTPWSVKAFVEIILQAGKGLVMVQPGQLLMHGFCIHVRIAMTSEAFCQNMAKLRPNFRPSKRTSTIYTPLLQVHPSKAVNERAGRPFVHDQNFAPCPTRFRNAISTNLPSLHHQKISPNRRGPFLVEGVPMIPGPSTSEPEAPMIELIPSLDLLSPRQVWRYPR